MAGRFLFFSPSWLGDAVMSLPTLYGLRTAYPDAAVGVVARGTVADLYRASNAASEVIVYKRQDGMRRVVGFTDFVARLRAFSADVALVLPRSFGAAWTALISDSVRRIGYRASGRDLLLTDPIPRDPSLLKIHRVHYYHHLLGALGIDSKPITPRIVVPDDAKARAKVHLAPLLEKRADRIVGIIPGAQYGTAKQWPEERYVALGKRLLLDLNAQLVLLGGPGDRDVCDRIRHEIDKDQVLDLSGKTTILELAGVLEACRFAVSNDTGAMHVASAVGTPVVAIFGSTDPVTTPPYGSIHTLLREPVECSPCLLRVCPIDHRCMRRIEVDRVFAACASRFD